MGKHDIKEIKEVSNDKAYYIARIRKLEAEIQTLKEDLKDAEKDVATITALYEQTAEDLTRSDARYSELVGQRKDEMAMCKEAIFLAAIREVSLR